MDTKTPYLVVISLITWQSWIHCLKLTPYTCKSSFITVCMISLKQVCATSFNPGPHCASQICSRAAIRIVFNNSIVQLFFTSNRYVIVIDLACSMKSLFPKLFLDTW